MGRNPYWKKPRPERREKDSGCIRRGRVKGTQCYEVLTPRWAGAEIIARRTFYFQAERDLEKWLAEHPKPSSQIDPTVALFTRENED